MNSKLTPQHSHDFLTNTHRNAKKVAIVFTITVVTMGAEIAAGIWSGSMALLADGWHMGTHAAAFAIAMFTYSYARKHKGDASFSFGPGKVQPLGGFASAVALGVVAILMAIESIERLLTPVDIHFNEAIAVATLGLIVNIVSVFVLHDDHHHDHHHGDHHHHKDHNLKAAYYHVLADALTSLLAIIALFSGMLFGWVWMDALMGIVGSIIISHWAYGLIKASSFILLDRTNIDLTKLKDTIEASQTVKVLDLHVWSITENNLAAILSVETSTAIEEHELKEQLAVNLPKLSHATVEVVRLT